MNEAFDTIDRVQNNQSKIVARSWVISGLNDLVKDGVKGEKLRLLTLPGKTWGFESNLLETEKAIRNKIEEIVGLESQKEIKRAAYTYLKALRNDYPNIKFTSICTTDYKFWEPSGNGRSKNNMARLTARVGSGFDMVWLDLMSQWCSGVEASLSGIANNIMMFDRAWCNKRAGLLYITVCVGREDYAHMDTFKMVQSSFGIDHYDKYGDPKYYVRDAGIATYLNQLTSTHDVFCCPISGDFYKEDGLGDDNRRRIMYLAGFHILPKTPERALLIDKLKHMPFTKHF